MFETIKTLKDEVGWILREYAVTRDSDAELIKRVCQRFGHDPVSKASAIERCRRWYNQRMQYLPTRAEIAKQRRLNMDEWKKALGYDNKLF